MAAFRMFFPAGARLEPSRSAIGQRYTQPTITPRGMAVTWRCTTSCSRQSSSGLFGLVDRRLKPRDPVLVNPLQPFRLADREKDSLGSIASDRACAWRVRSIPMNRPSQSWISAPRGAKAANCCVPSSTRLQAENLHDDCTQRSRCLTGSLWGLWALASRFE
jgi:hypothetical protein